MFAAAERSFMTRVAIGLEAEGGHIKYLLYEKGPFFLCVCFHSILSPLLRKIFDPS